MKIVSVAPARQNNDRYAVIAPGGRKAVDEWGNRFTGPSSHTVTRQPGRASLLWLNMRCTCRYINNYTRPDPDTLKRKSASQDSLGKRGVNLLRHYLPFCVSFIHENDIFL